jgi:formylglycine-generating enzyme required for sulfatase activity
MTTRTVSGLTLVATFLFFAAQSRAAVPFARNGQPLAVIVHGGHTEVAPNLSANHVRQGHIRPPVDELAHYLRQITGAEFVQVESRAEAGKRPAIVLALVDRVAGADDGPAGQQAYRIKTDGNQVTLTAATPLGLHYAVYGLLEDHLGCRFYTFTRRGLSYAGPGFEVVPKRPTLTLPAIDELHQPAFPNRGVIFWMGSYPWILKNRGLGLPGDHTSGALAAGHNLYHLLPPEPRKVRGEEIPGLFAEHSDFYPMTAAGQREPGWAMGICGTNPKLPSFLAAALEREIRSRVERAGDGPVDWSQPFSAAQGDGFAGCHCDACRKLVHAEESEAAPLVLALNRTLDILAEKYPKAQVITFAYFETLDAPKTLTPHPNLWINVVSSARSQNMAGDQMGLIAGNPANRDYARAIRQWPQIAPDRVTVWHWDSFRAEWPSMFYTAENLRYMHECGVYGVNPQFCGGPWVDLLAWLCLKLAWNPEQDADRLIRQFCEDNYGKEAAAHVWDYLKLAQRGYEESLHVPSAVRWSGWTPTLRVKLFRPSLLDEMTAAMDRATAAAEKAGDHARLANLIAARGQSLDIVLLDGIAYEGQLWGPVRFDGDGKRWFVAGADPRVPPALMRARQGIVADGGGEQGVLRSLSRYAAGNGGPLVELTGKAFSAAVCPDLKGQIVSAVDKAGDKELLAVQDSTSGYQDVFERIAAQLWLPADQGPDILRRMNEDWSQLWSDFRPAAADRLETHLALSASHYGFDSSRRLNRMVRVTEGGLRIERTYTGKLDHPNRFTARWLLALPEPRQAKVSVRGGSIDRLLDLRYAVPGGIQGVRAGERLPGADYMDERFDMVLAVSDAEVVTLPLAPNAAGEVVVTLDRGDGVAAVLSTPATGWEAVELKPVVEKHYLEVTLVGAVQTAGDDAVENLPLPPQTLMARKVPAAALATEKADQPDGSEAATVPPRIRVTSPNAAVNEIDGAELVWVPAGEFLRGSPEGVGGNDERPQKTIHLDGFWIYKHPVTVEQYRKFCEATGKEFKPIWGQQMRANPKGDEGCYAVQVNWYEAADYAGWAGAALPTEAQWEKSARGTDGREYPWGDQWDPARCASMEETLYRFSPGFRPVDSYPGGASPYGALDMAGNVWEWVADWYAYEAYRGAPDKNPTGPATGSHKVLRGGSSLYDERFSRCAARMTMPPHVRDWTPTGFRCTIAEPGPDAPVSHGADATAP